MAATNGKGGPIAVLEEDLFFLGRIASVALASGLGIVVIKPGEPLPIDTPAVIVDLAYSGNWETLVREARGHGVDVIGFGPHVDGSLMRRGREAGCTRVMAKSKFVTELPKIMGSWAARGQAATT